MTDRQDHTMPPRIPLSPTGDLTTFEAARRAPAAALARRWLGKRPGGRTAAEQLDHLATVAAEAARLPTFEDLRRDTYRTLGDALDIMRSDWRPGHGPAHDQTDPWHEARRLIAAAKEQLNEVARRSEM